MAQFYDIDDSGLDYTEGTCPAIPSSVQDVDDDFYGDAAAPPTADQLQFQDLQDPEAGAYSPYGAAPIVGSETDFGDVPLEPIGSPGGGGSGGKDFGGDDMVEVDTDEAAKEEEEEELELSDKFWKLAYYRSFYNVDVLEVAKRIGKVFLPIGDDFFTAVKGNADLYGWLWIASTLVFVMAVTGNFASYLSYAFAGRADEWQYDFTKLTFGALTVYIYVTVMPLLVWVAMKLWLEFEPSVVDYFCLYGYSLAPYIPAAIAMMVPMYFVRWIIVGVAAVSVSVFLARNWIPFLKKRPAESGGILAVMLVANLVLALIFMVYFFNYSVTAAEESSEDASSNEEPQTTYEVESSYYEEPSVTPVPSPSASATPSVTPSVTPTLSVTPTPTVSATTTPTTTPTSITNAGEY